MLYKRTVMAAVFLFFFLDFIWFYRYIGSLEV